MEAVDPPLHQYSSILVHSLQGSSVLHAIGMIYSHVFPYLCSSTYFCLIQLACYFVLRAVNSSW